MFRKSRKQMLVFGLVACAAFLNINPAARAGGIPVIDVTNLNQNIITAIEEISQTLKQIEQYETQLRQYEQQIKNSIAPTAYIWDRATKTMDDANKLIYRFNALSDTVQNLAEYLERRQTVAYYKSSPCFRREGCSAEEQAALIENRAIGSAAGAATTTSLLKLLETQQATLNSDAVQLESIQLGAGGAAGQMAALGYANQLASNQANQLLQIRAVLIAHQTAWAVREQEKLDREAIAQAAHEAATAAGEKFEWPRNGVYRSWTLDRE